MFKILRRSFSVYSNINRYSEKKISKITMKNLIDYKDISINNRIIFLNEELKIRLSKKVIELENFPYGISQMPSINKISHWYITSFKELSDFDNKNNGE